MKKLFSLFTLTLLIVPCSGNSNDKIISYHENGQIEKEGIYINGKEEGKWIWYYENGQVKSEGKYKNGNKDGEWVNYYEKRQFKRFGFTRVQVGSRK